LRLLFIFVDGIGLGTQQVGNPFVFTDTPGISSLLDGQHLTENAKNHKGSKATLLGLDATLNVPGFPQSATGQASIFTGSNAAAYLGRHLRGFPNSALRGLISRKSMFKQLREKGFRVAFANAYRPSFFDLLRCDLPGNRFSCSTLTAYYGGLPFLGLDDLKAGNALYMDITNDTLQRMGFDVPLIAPEKGAERLIEISRNFDFCLFEYFLSDLAGHLAEQSESGRVISILDSFIGSLAEQIDPQEEMILVSSDHGNLEDLSSRRHTINEVPALLIGDLQKRRQIDDQLKTLTDLLPAINTVLEL